MINFTCYKGPLGIPIYYQEIPSLQTVAFHWVIFAGGADDDLVGAHGVHHWFEHVPFRGTKKFPDYHSINKPYARYGGKVGAWTSNTCTCYFAHALKEQAEQVFDVVTDLWSAPLLEDESIKAEYKIILEEIRRKNSSVEGRSSYARLSLLFPGHPFGHHVLGNEESLSSISTDTLRKTHSLSYDHSRAVLFVSGNISIEKVLELIGSSASSLPSHNLSERRKPHHYGTLPKWNKEEIVVSTEFPSSYVSLFFPCPDVEDHHKMSVWSVLGTVIGGGQNSPLFEIVRGERHLTYSPMRGSINLPTKKFGGFEAETSKENVDKLVEAFWDVVNSEKIRSRERFEETKDILAYGPRMRNINAVSFNYDGIDTLRYSGRVINDDEYFSSISSVTYEETMALIDEIFNADVSKLLVFRGKGK